MVVKIFSYIADQIKKNNPWIKSFSVNCIQLPDGNVVNILGQEKTSVTFDDTKGGTGFYIKTNPRYTFSKQTALRSDKHEYTVTINFKFVFFAINQSNDLDCIKLTSKFIDDLQRILFLDYTGEERKPELILIGSNFDAISVFKDEIGKYDESGAKINACSIDAQIKFLSSNDGCGISCIESFYVKCD